MMMFVAERTRRETIPRNGRRGRMMASRESIGRISSFRWVVTHGGVSRGASGVLRSLVRLLFWVSGGHGHAVCRDQCRDGGNHGRCEGSCSCSRPMWKSIRITFKGYLVGRVRDAVWRRDPHRLERAPRLSPASRRNDSTIAGLIRCETSCRESRAKKRNEIVTNRPTDSGNKE